MSEGHIAHPPSRKKLLALLGMALLTATLIVMGAVLPAEYHLDPLGVGRITGLLQLSRPREVTLTLPDAHIAGAPARFYEHELHNDRIDIPLAAGGDSEHRDAVEWKVRMKAGDTMVFSWSVAAPANEFYFDFHGQSDPSPEVKVLSYREGLGTRSSGTMTAAFDGIHGWFLQNQSAAPVVVHLELSGFYQMRPDPYAPE